MSKSFLDTGFWFGLALMAVITFILNWFIYSELKTQRDYWMQLYCVRAESQLHVCGVDISL
jgi:hypothetical protein